MKVKKKKKKLRVKVLLIIIFLLYVIFQLGYYIINLPIDNIVVKGNSSVSESVILSYANIVDSTKFFTLSKKNIEDQLLENPFIKEVEVEKVFLHNLNITVVENKTLFYYQYNSELILEGGESTEEITSIVGYPTLINYTPSDVLTDFITELSKIDQDLINKISEIEYSPNIKDDIILDEERFIFKMNDGNTVYVNTINLEKFANYDSILEVESQKGTLYLDSSNDGNVFDIYD